MKRYMKMAEKMTQHKAARPGDFLDALAIMKRECKVDNLKLSDWGVTMAEVDALADKTIATGGAMLDLDPRFLTRNEIADIFVETIRED